MAQIKKNLELIREKIDAAANRVGRDPGDVQLIAVSKKKSVELIKEAFECGQTTFGENYLQEATEKISSLDSAINWHFIGHLQSNKAAIATNIFNVIETVDRLKIAASLDRSLTKNGDRSMMPVLIQVNIGREPQKAGVMPENTGQLLRDMQIFSRIRILGLMVMPPFSLDPEQVRPYFRQTKELALSLQAQGLFAKENKVQLSMGMSGDYEVAIEEGSTMVRVGTALFGDRY